MKHRDEKEALDKKWRQLEVTSNEEKAKTTRAEAEKNAAKAEMQRAKQDKKQVKRSLEATIKKISLLQ